MSDDLRGLRVTVLRRADSGDCSLNGISASHDRLTVIGYTLPGSKVVVPLASRSQVSEPTEGAPAVAFAVRHIYGLFGEGETVLVDVVPVESDGSGTYRVTPGMEGGNYASLGDSRLTDLVSELVGHRFHGAVPIHDRFEP